ncbi:putative mitochondrial carrier [Tolypocladium ophioglossoides CBS 100239]|uniref:Putative mitochondrial carrier n=1 Tax=Tolypocladium ophioglossoides (strain CBS 100239) TaxID=1163406 RepID=A0A0L0NJ11_TOLOC|nr:putative mitochondrial carrier [Tolypocladium ophioglossoides CBS 100239]
MLIRRTAPSDNALTLPSEGGHYCEAIDEQPDTTEHLSSQVANASQLNQVIFKDKAGAPIGRKFVSLFPGLGYAAGYKVLQRIYKYGGQPVARDFLAEHYGKDFESAFGKKTGKAIMHSTAGSLIGIGEIVLLPLDVLKIKRQTNPEAFKGRGVFKIVADEGFGLYRGWGWTAARNAPGSFALFGGSAFAKEYLFHLQDYNKATWFQNFVASIAGASASLVVSAPLDVIKTRIQNRNFDNPESGFRILTNMARQEGFSSFFKGLVPKKHSALENQRHAIYAHRFHMEPLLEGGTVSHLSDQEQDGLDPLTIDYWVGFGASSIRPNPNKAIVHPARAVAPTTSGWQQHNTDAVPNKRHRQRPPTLVSPPSAGDRVCSLSAISTTAKPPCPSSARHWSCSKRGRGAVRILCIRAPFLSDSSNMPHTDRDSSRDGDRRLKHQHSASSDQGNRALVPMWDSSDPDRAPPPLPLNPQSPSFTSRAGTSSAIQSAHAALSERARESAALIPVLAKRVNDGSPEKALVKGNSHRRMQSLQPGSVRDLSLLLEGGRNTPGSPGRSDRPSTPTQNYLRESAFEPRPQDGASEASTPIPGPSLTPIVRPAVRRPPPQSILGENAPPQSSTMLALQAMGTQPLARDADSALTNITNGAATNKGPQSVEGLSGQILTLTNIAQSLQKELSQLSRRSRDNATDLLSLKEATSTRDEDIRRSLRDLMGNVSDASSRISSREHYGGLFLDNKPHCTSPSNGRPFQLPRIPSPKSFADSIDRGSISTPSLSGADGPASFALLERILRGLGTKDGHESLAGLLNELSEKLSGMATAAKVDELAQLVREQSESAIVPDVSARGRKLSEQGPRGLDLDYSQPGMTQRVERLLQNGEARMSSAPSVRGADLLNEDLIKIIRSVKDSVSQGGGLTAEVKALVRELRGEVLGMGRELGKRLEKMDTRAVEESDPPSKDDVSRVIDEGLEQMKEQLNHVLREHRRQSQASASSQKTLVDYQEIYNAMRAALRDNEASRGDMPDLSREDVIEAVRDAWENYKPEIEVQQLGLEREEVLTCLKEGIQEYMPRDEKPAGATRDEVFKAVVEGLKHFVPPQMDTTATVSRDEIIEAVRDCLEEFEFPVAASAIGHDMTHNDMVHAVKEGLEGLDLPRSNALVAHSNNDEVVSRLQDIMEYMKLEFRAVSEEAKENVAANGRDTEQVLDATKDGLESLRIAIESYVDRATGAGQEEFMESLSRSIEEIKEELTRAVSQANDSSREQVQTELEGLREVVNSSMIPASPQGAGNNQEVLEALHNGLSSLRQEILRPRPETSEILDALQDGLNELRAGIDRVTNKPVDLTANDEILDALKSGLESVRSDIETLREGNNEKAVAAVATIGDDVHEHAMIPADMVKQDDIKNLEVLITQLRIKVEAMEPEMESESVHKEDLARLEDMIRNVQEGVQEISSREPPVAAAKEEETDPPTTNGDAATRDDVEAIETLLRNTKARLDDLIDGEQAVRKEHLDAVETLVLETRETIGSITSQLGTISQKEDLAGLEALLTQLTVGLSEIKEHSEKVAEDDDKVTKTDVEAVETVVLEIKTALDGLAGTDFAAISNKEDITILESLIKEAKEKLEAYTESSTQALDDRQAEIVGVADRVTEVKTFLEEFQDTVKGKLEEGSTGIESLSKLLETMGEKIDKNETVGQDLKEMFDAMKTQFEESKEVVAGARLESNEKLQEATENIGTKIDDKITELIAKYAEFTAAMDEKSATGEARDIETEAAVVGTKAVAEELKLLIDTLGSTVTDSLEKMEEASKTVFSKVEELAARTEESQTDSKTEHQQTRDHNQHAVTMVEGLQGDVKEYQPQILEAVKDILLLVGEHFEHSKSATTDLQDKIIESKPPEQQMLAPPEKYDDSEVQEKLNRLVEQKYDDSDVREKLSRLMEERYDDSEIRQKLDHLVELKYDDANVHEKLDKLVDHSTTAAQTFTHLETLDKVHQSVVKTAAEISQFLSSQTQRIEDDYEDRERILQDTMLALERKAAEKEHMEASVLSLKDEEERLRKSVMNLRTEQESLIRQKTRLTGDVSSLETAMRLRKEKLSDMEHRAERLERRIMEGVMDHSRVLLITKRNKDRDNMSRKRVKKPAIEQTEASKPRPAVSMALSAKRHLAPPAQNGAARRIASLSQMNNNMSSNMVKRSQSVRTPAGANSLRKRSWGGGLAKGFDAEDKENVGMRETVEELEEPDTATAPSPDGGTVANVEFAGEDTTVLDSTLDDDGHSDADTLRRSSMGTTVITSSTDQYTASEAGYSEYDEGSEYTESAVGTDVGTDAGAENGLVLYGQE